MTAASCWKGRPSGSGCNDARSCSCFQHQPTFTPAAKAFTFLGQRGLSNLYRLLVEPAFNQLPPKGPQSAETHAPPLVLKYELPAKGLDAHREHSNGHGGR